MVVRPAGYELPLVKEQLARKAGTFACEEYALISERTLPIQGVDTIVVSTVSVSGATKDGTSPNAPIFVEAWQKIKEDGRYSRHDWIVKCDPDTVFLPARLKAKLAPGRQPPNPYPPPFQPAPGAGQWVTNCDKMKTWGQSGWGKGWPMMYGAVEIISREAIDNYYTHLGSCQARWPTWHTMGEDAFMGLCLRQLHAGELFIRQGDQMCTGGDCTDGSMDAFHPHKDIQSWMQCWDQATR